MLAALDEVPGAHHHGCVRDVACGGEVVGDVEHGHAPFIAEFAHQIENSDADGDVEHRGGFVGEDDVGFHGQGSGDGDALPLSAGQLMGVWVEHRSPRPTVAMSSRSSFEGCRAVVFSVKLQGTRQEVLDAVCRVEGSEGVLEDHLDLAAVSH